MEVRAHQYKTTGHIIVLHFLILKVSTSMTEKKNSRLNDSNIPEHSDNYSYTSFPKTRYSATISKDLRGLEL